MTKVHSATRSAMIILGGLLAGGVAKAQYGGAGQPGGMPAPPMGQEPKEEGPAEAAPEEEHPTNLEPLPGYAEQGRKRMQIFEIDGYMRMRGDYLHNFFLGEGYSSQQAVPSTTMPHETMQAYGKPPFPLPLGCKVAPDLTGTVGPFAGTKGCGTKGMGSANMRLRMEPTLNITDQVRVHAQIDILDNTLLGSTPDSLVGTTRGAADPTGAAPAPIFYNTQNPPELGQNGYLTSIRAKRAWGEVDSEFGSLRFGRMPWNWGRGITYNDGNCPDCDGGTNINRLMVLTQLYGHQLAASFDFGAQGVTTQQLNLGRDNPGSYPIDLSQDDDVVQFMASVSKIDGPVQLRERIDRGDLVVNYGLQVVYRSQQSQLPIPTTAPPGFAVSVSGGAPTREDVGPTPLVAYDALAVTPDLWFKLYFKSLTVEMEGTAVLGKIDHAEVLSADGGKLSLRQFGWVLATDLKLYRDSFFLGFETGGATGDQAENRAGYLNYRWKFVQQPNGDRKITDFKFSPDYHIDEIFFRQIVGTVTNAIYFKPKVAYWFDLQQNRQIGLLGSLIYSMAQTPVSTPGNALSYGLEMDVGATYRNTGEGFYAGVVWGVFWPMAALDRPVNVWADTDDVADATAAQVLRTFLGIRF